MSSLFSKALVYLGLVDEAEMDPDAPQEQAPVRLPGAVHGAAVAGETRRRNDA